MVEDITIHRNPATSQVIIIVKFFDGITERIDTTVEAEMEARRGYDNPNEGVIRRLSRNYSGRERYYIHQHRGDAATRIFLTSTPPARRVARIIDEFNQNTRPDDHIVLSHPQWEAMHLAHVENHMYGESAILSEPYLVSRHPLGFAIAYNRAYNQMTQPLVFNAESLEINVSMSETEVADLTERVDALTRYVDEANDAIERRVEFENPYTALEIDRMLERHNEIIRGRRSGITNILAGQFYQRMARHFHLPRSVRMRAVSEISLGDIVQSDEEGNVSSIRVPDILNRIMGVAINPAREGDTVTVALQGQVTIPVNPYPRNHDADDRQAIRRDRDRYARGGNPFLENQFYGEKRKHRKYFSAKTGLKHTPCIKDVNAQGEKFMAFRGTDHIDLVSIKQYGGCEECFWYSLVFHAKQAPDGTKIIDTDEDFEKVKAHFVKHFNKAHPEIVAKKMALKNPEKMT